MRNSLLFSAFFFFFLFIAVGMEAQNPNQLSRRGKQGKGGADTLSQQLITDYGLLSVLDSITILSPADSIILRPEKKGQTFMTPNGPEFRRWNDIVVKPNTNGATVANGIKRSGNMVTKLQICFWPDDEEGPRDDLWLDFVPSASTDPTLKGSFVFSGKPGDKIKLGEDFYFVVSVPKAEEGDKTSENLPCTTNITEKDYNPNVAEGREAPLPPRATKSKH